MKKAKDTNTETVILQVAKKIFQKKGMTGARMQEIASEAGINKAMLHYYYRNKQLLFEAVFKDSFSLLAPKLNKIINADMPLFNKIEAFTNSYIAFVLKHPYLPNFIIQELNRNPEFVKKLVTAEHFPNITVFKKQVESCVKNKMIRPINPDQLFINMMALNVFPFIGAPLLMGFTRTNKEQYKNLIKQRKTEVSQFIIQAIKL